MYRYDEKNDIELLESSATPRPTGEKAQVVQDFKVKYRKPFLAGELNDVTLVPK